LSVYISPATNFSTTGTACVRGIGIIAGQDGVVTCPAANGTRFVTIERRDPISSDVSVLVEARGRYTHRVPSQEHVGEGQTTRIACGLTLLPGRYQNPPR
jgi:hypothetical protein